MFNLLLLLIIRLVDLPVWEDYPLVLIKIIKYEFSKGKPLTEDIRVLIEKHQIEMEASYTLSVGLFEYDLMLQLTQGIQNKPFLLWFFIKSMILVTALYSWRLGIPFVVGSCLLPIVCYYFFVLMDYLEVLEELLEYIRERL